MLSNLPMVMLLESSRVSLELGSSGSRVHDPDHHQQKGDLHVVLLPCMGCMQPCWLLRWCGTVCIATLRLLQEPIQSRPC